MKTTPKYVITALLLVFVFGSLAYTLLRDDQIGNRKEGSARPLGETIPVVQGVDPDWAVYFFYNDVYCETCERLEGYALEAVRTHFADDLESGVIQWRSLDMTTPENKHYAVDFGLYSKSVVLVELDDGEEVRWENLDDIWDLVHDQPAYMDYIRSSLKTFMDGPQ